MNINLKNSILIVLLATAGISYGQVRISNSILNSSATNSSAFIDASSNATYNGSTNIGKGLLYPRVDLSTFTAFGGTPTGIPASYPTRYDGFVVYNTKVGGVASVGLTAGELTQGFWFYENKTTNLTGGTWKPVGSSSAVDIKTTETVKNESINGAPLYALKSTFTVTAGNTAITLAAPAGISSLYKITIYKDGGVFGTTLHSYNKATGAAFTGSPGMSVVYPTGTYDYVLEYLK